MNIAYVLLVHKSPELVERLVRRLSSPGSFFFIHVDGKVPLDAYRRLSTLPGVRLVEARVPVRWGGFSIVQATINGLRAARAAGPFGTYAVLSGQDYPLVGTEALTDFFARHADRSFIDHRADLPDWWASVRDRVEQYHLPDATFRGKDRLAELASRVLPRRTPPLPGTLYGGPGATWFTLSPAAATELLDTLDQRPELSRFGRYTWGADEFFLQSLVMAGTQAAGVHLRSLWYMDWSAGRASPEVLTLAHRPALEAATDCLFVRKVDLPQSAALLDWLDGRAKG
jgi:hypothetical protein